MDTVSFITTQTGDDLILSFAIVDRADAEGIRSLTLLRTPKYEFFMPTTERGVHVLFEGQSQGYLKSFEFSELSRMARLTTPRGGRELDFSHVSDQEVQAMRQVLGLMVEGGHFELRNT